MLPRLATVSALVLLACAAAYAQEGPPPRGDDAAPRQEGPPLRQEEPPPPRQQAPPPRADTRGARCGAVAYTADGAFGAAYGMENCGDAERLAIEECRRELTDKDDCARGVVTRQELVVPHSVLSPRQRLDHSRHQQAHARRDQPRRQRVGAEIQVRLRQLPPCPERPRALRRPAHEDVDVAADVVADVGWVSAATTAIALAQRPVPRVTQLFSKLGGLLGCWVTRGATFKHCLPADGRANPTLSLAIQA